MKELIAAIKDKKELKDLSNVFVKEALDKFLNQNPKVKAKLKEKLNPKSKDFKLAVKNVRSSLRRVYGLFRNEGKKRKLLVAQLTSKPSKKQVVEILETHASTKERLRFYEPLYKRIFKITDSANILLDLGCGINPFSHQFMGLGKLEYYAYDLHESEIKDINTFFKISKIKGEAKVLDVSKTNKLKELPEADVAFLFKVSAVLDKGKGHKKTEEVISAIPARFVVVSFPTLTMSGKPMNAPQRKWMEWLCNRRGWSYEICEFENEIFYVVGK